MEEERVSPALPDRLRDRLGDSLRSVVGYTRNDYTVHYLRDDVAADYDDAEIARGVEEMRFESLEAEYVNDLFAERHGELRCNVTFFEDAVELNFPLSETEGLAVAVDADHFARQDSFVQYVLDLVTDAE
ncbi:hypothetical protein GCM10009037_17820 [Halarchaeum grantii]|uniref:Uncharacterized protein n=1 Tax=Halarchaeum grantii TaxID=1193105 RepID=A0A830FAE3_9EURY|nr:hypothetical protein [Halarchaeum grantii]GGL34636.1 hypothetical protein GCM10009037_17820 [Halarchaeum grantii]